MLQLQEQLDAVDAVLHLCTPQLKLRLQNVQQKVLEQWEELRLSTEQRQEELKLACERYLFLNTVSGETNQVIDDDKDFDDKTTRTALMKMTMTMWSWSQKVMFLFPVQVQDYLLWCGQLIDMMAAEESISDMATADLQLVQHQQLWAEMEAREETYHQAVNVGKVLQKQDKRHKTEVRTSAGKRFEVFSSTLTL